MSESINITLPDGAVRQYPKGTTALDIAKSISEGLARKVLAAEVNGQVWDATRSINDDANVKLLMWDDGAGKNTFWHSSAHLMAEAIESLFPGVKFWVGPPVENGFYYDVDLGNRSISEEDLKRLEVKMAELAKQNNSYIRKEISKADAIEYFTGKGDEYKLDLLQNLEDGNISFYTQGSFTDLCRGPHIPSTGFIKAIKLTNIAGAYWKGNEKTNSSPAFTGLHFLRRNNWMSICRCWKKQRRETIVSLERSLAFLQWMMMWARVCLCGCPMEPSLLKNWKSWQRKQSRKPAIKEW